MKKRRLIITAFILCASLVIGIGYATLTGTLDIDGTATFKGKDALGEQVVVGFTSSKTGTNCTDASIDTSDTTKANITVVFNDTLGNAYEFTGNATYKISYDVADDTLPSVMLNAPTATVTAGTANKGEFTITATYSPDLGGTGGSVDLSTNTVVLKPGQTVDVVVAVKYDNSKDNIEVETDEVEATIAVDFSYSTIG